MKQSACLVRLFTILSALILSYSVQSQQSAEKYTRQTDYLLGLPDGYAGDTTQKWPLLIFLHGSGERGSDIEKVKINGVPKLLAKGKKLPFIVVSPQAKEDEDGWETDHLFHLLQYIKTAYRVDPDRIYLTGLSMGGFGTWALALNHPEEFAAIIPVCGGGDTSKAWRLRNTAVWCFHGALDNVVPLAKDEQMINALRKYNPRVQFTVYPDMYHNSWERAYENDSIYSWLLSQKKFSYKEIHADPGQLRKFTGTYRGAEGDTIRMTLDSSGLHAATKENSFLLKAAAGNTFFISPNMQVDLRFIPNSRGIFDSFIVYEETRTVYKRIH